MLRTLEDRLHDLVIKLRVIEEDYKAIRFMHDDENRKSMIAINEENKVLLGFEIELLKLEVAIANSQNKKGLWPW